MPINSEHPTYNISRAIETEDAYNENVKQEKYVAKLADQTTAKYNQYLDRGIYFNVTSRTTSAIIGTVLRKDPITDDSFQTVDELSERELLSDLLKGLLLRGKAGIHTDFDEEANSAVMIPINGNNIVNWRDDGTLVVLKEGYYVEDKDDKYKLIAKTRYRELFLDEGTYTVQLWEQEGGINSYKFVKVGEPMVPTVKGIPLDYIPFEFINPFDTTSDTYSPVLFNLAQINVSHFRTSVDLEHIAHFSALPQPWIAGDFQSSGDADEQPVKVLIGSDQVWHLAPESKVGYLEFSGIAIDSVADILRHKEEQMLAVGIRLLSNKNAVESAETIKIRSNTENATLLSMTLSIESAVQNSLETVNLWNGVAEEPLFSMSKDFVPAQIAPEEITVQLQLLNEGKISQETFLENLSAGEIIPSVEEEVDRLNSTTVEGQNVDNLDL